MNSDEKYQDGKNPQKLNIKTLADLNFVLKILTFLRNVFNLFLCKQVF